MKKIHKNKIVMAVLILAIFIGTVYLYYFKIGTFVSTDSIIIQEMQLDDYVLKLNGNTMNSGQGYSSYKLKSKNNDLYIQLRYSVVSGFNPTGQFKIDKPGLYEGIKAVYLQGKDTMDVKLIWHK